MSHGKPSEQHSSPEPPPDSALGAAADSGRLPAWAVSIVIHLSLLVALGLVKSRSGLPGEEPGRAVGLVLARVNADEPTEYLDQDAVQPSEALDASQPPMAAAELPAMTLPELPLPGADESVPLDSDLLDQPDLTPGRRTRPGEDVDLDRIRADEAARRGPAGPSGPTARVSLFGGAPAEGHSFVFVIDRSNSMGGNGLNALAAAETEFDRALQALTPAHRFQIVAYHYNRVLFQEGEMATATPANKARVSDFMQGLAAFGGTNHEMALNSALRWRPDVIFLLSDGGDPGLAPHQLDEIRRRSRGRTTIHCIQFGYKPETEDNHFMRRLAAATGGHYQYVRMRRSN